MNEATLKDPQRDSSRAALDPFAEMEDGADRPWPKLCDLAMSENLVRQRRTLIGGSDANILMSGDNKAILDLWLEKRGEKAPADLSTKLAVAIGSWTEEFNRQWCERVRGKAISRRGTRAPCLKNAWRWCTIDGFIAEDNALWEAKHTNAFASSQDVLERYMPQLQHNMAVCEVDRIVLSVIFGNHRFEIFEIAEDWAYQIDLLEAERDFWDCVQSGREPVARTPIPIPKPVGVREVSMEGKNEWAVAAYDWLNLREASRKCTAAVVALKSMTEDDVARAFGHGVEARRSKNGAITIREQRS